MKKLLILFSFVLFSCRYEPQPHQINCEFPGGIILQKCNFKKTGLGNECYFIKYQGKIYDYIEVYDIDSHYEVGDTIKEKCIN